MGQDVDVSDLFDGFHRLVSELWESFGRESAADEEGAGVPFDEVVDQLEVDVFLPACARRLRERLGLEVEPEEVTRHVRLVGSDGPIPGAPGRYHSHAFHPESIEGDVTNAVLAADLMPRTRADVRLVLVLGEEGRAPRGRRGQLPVR